MIDLKSLVDAADQIMQPEKVTDYCPNGLQVEGRGDVAKIVSGVTASYELIERALAAKADVLLVHHGYFWKGENAVITGIKKRRLKLLLEHNLSLLAYHLPLDIHPLWGNNVQLGARLGFEVLGPLDDSGRPPVGLVGQVSEVLAPDELVDRIAKALGRQPQHIAAERQSIKKVAWCTGAGQGYMQQAIDAGVDAFISGEISEPTVHLAKEGRVHYFAAGHHATERYGVQAFGAALAQQFGLVHEFIDVANPV